MILYMDVYITNAPLFKNMYDDLSELRSRIKIYNMPDKIDITLYTLASYALYKWSNVLIKYELEDQTRNDYFEKEIKKIFPKAVVIRGRSDTQAKHQKSIKMMEKMKDEWIFYLGNNDHPFVFADPSILDKCLEKAREMRKTFPFVSIWFTHIQEAAALLDKQSTFSKILNQNMVSKEEIIYEDENLYVTKRSKGFYASTQIVHVDVLHHWFFDKDFGDKRIRRSDELNTLIETNDQVLILPKKQICEHFDGYGNLDSIVGFKVYEVVPPLFIPPGFFEKNIKIAFGYDQYREGWVNVNPAKKKYSFQDQVNGTDMKIGLDNIPLFWKSRVAEIDINPQIDQHALEALGHRNYEKICSPWPKSLWQVYATKYVISPVWRASKFIKRTGIYIKDPQFLDENKDAGGPLFRAYKKVLLFVLRKFKHSKST